MSNAVLRRASFLGVALASLAAVTAQAAIVGTGGAVIPVPAPPSCLPLAYPTGFNIHAWDEQTNVLGPKPVEISTNPGSSAAMTPGIIAGAVNSHFIHIETLPGTVMAGWIDFDAPIIGVAFRDSSIDATDAIAGALGTAYPTGNVFRGLGPPINAGTGVIVNPGSTNPNRLEIFVNTTPIGPSNLVLDQVRVYTAVPAPASALAMAGLGVLGRRRRR